MFGKRMATQFINRSATNEEDRRNFLKLAGAAGIGVAGATMLPFGGVTSAFASSVPDLTTAQVTDEAVLNFALNLEYLEAEFYSHAVNGHGLASNLTGGTGTLGGVTGGSAVPFKTKAIAQIAKEIAGDELSHVTFLRSALGSAAVSRPAIDIVNSFTGLAIAAGIIKAGQTFDPYENETNFLLGAFVFEDVGVTAYKGAAPLISNKTYLSAAAGILAVEAYHAGTIRTLLFQAGQADPSVYTTVSKIAGVRDAVDGPGLDEQGILMNGSANIVPTDANGIALGRNAANVLNVVYANPAKVSKGGFYPNGVNGSINTSA
jgi:hypothetical protein